MKDKLWEWWEVLLWAYSTLYAIFIMFIAISMVLNPYSSKYTPPADDRAGGITFLILTLPVLIFLVFEGIKHIGRKNIQDIF